MDQSEDKGCFSNSVGCLSRSSFCKRFNQFVSNRWVRGVIFCLIAFCSSGMHYGWQQFSMILAKGRAYEYVCDEGWDTLEMGRCERQEAAIQTLYSVGLASEMGIGILAGVLFDHLGPRGCGMIGITFLISGWLLFAYSTNAFPAYIPAIILTGGAVNLITYPTFILGDLFPKKKGFALALLIGCQSSCSVIPVILLAIWNRFPNLEYQNLFIGYLCYIWIPLYVFYISALPCHRMVAKAEEDAPSAETELAVVTASDVSLPATKNASFSPEEPKTEVSRESFSTADVSQSEEKGNAPKMVETHGDWKVFLKEMATPDVHLFTIYHVMQLMQATYFTTTVFAQSGEAVSRFFGYVQPSQTLFAFIYGSIVDKTGSLFICCFINTLMVLCFVIVVTSVNALQYAAVVLNCMAAGFLYSSKYIFIADTYPPDNFGKILGYTGGVMAGTFTLLNIPIVNSMLLKFWNIFFLVTTGICFFPLGILIIRQRQGKSYKQKLAKIREVDHAKNPSATVEP